MRNGEKTQPCLSASQLAGLDQRHDAGLTASDSSGWGLPVPIGLKRDRDLNTELEPCGLGGNSPEIRKQSPMPIFAGTSSDQELEWLVDCLLTQ
jgi:hypothetical protein